jgi:hypothetical protein
MAGASHATQHIPDCIDGYFDYAEVPENRPRFVLSALLYGWCVSSDHQFLYEKQEPHFVHSVDHGHFLPGSISWNVTTLRAAVDTNIDDVILRKCGIREIEARRALRVLEHVEDSDLAYAVAAARSEWGITIEERVELLGFFIRRRDDLLTLRP